MSEIASNARPPLHFWRAADPAESSASQSEDAEGGVRWCVDAVREVGEWEMWGGAECEQRYTTTNKRYTEKKARVCVCQFRVVCQTEVHHAQITLYADYKIRTRRILRLVLGLGCFLSKPLLGFLSYIHITRAPHT